MVKKCQSPVQSPTYSLAQPGGNGEGALTQDEVWLCLTDSLLANSVNSAAMIQGPKTLRGRLSRPFSTYRFGHIAAVLTPSATVSNPCRAAGPEAPNLY